MDYLKAWQTFSAGEYTRRGVKLAPHTYLNRVERHRLISFTVSYRGSTLLIFQPSGVVIYDHHGFMTAATKGRMTRFGPAPVVARKGHWFVGREPWVGSRFFYKGGADELGLLLMPAAEKGDTAAAIRLAKYWEDKLTGGSCYCLIMKANNR